MHVHTHNNTTTQQLNCSPALTHNYSTAMDRGRALSPTRRAVSPGPMRPTAAAVATVATAAVEKDGVGGAGDTGARKRSSSMYEVRAHRAHRAHSFLQIMSPPSHTRQRFTHIPFSITCVYHLPVPLVQFPTCSYLWYCLHLRFEIRTAKILSYFCWS